MVIGLIVRAGIVTGAVYYTRELGVWSDTEKTEKLYNDIKNELRPHAQQLSKQIPFEVPALPKSGELSFLANHYYNRGVKGTFHFIEMIPCYTGQMVMKAKKALDEFSQSPPVSAANNEKK